MRWDDALDISLLSTYVSQRSRYTQRPRITIQHDGIRWIGRRTKKNAEWGEDAIGNEEMVMISSYHGIITFMPIKGHPGELSLQQTYVRMRWGWMDDDRTRQDGMIEGDVADHDDVTKDVDWFATMFIMKGWMNNSYTRTYSIDINWWLVYSTFLRKEHPSVRRALPPVGWQRTVEHEAQNTTVAAWENIVVIWKQPGHFTSMKNELGDCTKRLSLCWRAS